MSVKTSKGAGGGLGFLAPPALELLGLTEKKGTVNSLNCNLYPYKFLFFMLCVISAFPF